MNILELIKNEKVEWKSLNKLINYEQSIKYIIESTEYDDFTTSNHWIDFKFKVKSSAMKILKAKMIQLI